MQSGKMASVSGRPHAALLVRSRSLRQPLIGRLVPSACSACRQRCTLPGKLRLRAVTANGGSQQRDLWLPDDSPTADLAGSGARLPVSETQQPPRRQQAVAAAQQGGADGRMRQQPIVARREYADEGYREGRGPRDPRDAMYRERAFDDRETRSSVDGSVVQKVNDPPDLASQYLDNCTILLGLPLTPTTVDIIIAQLVHLKQIKAQKNRPKNDGGIVFQINSTGVQREDGQMIGFETQGLGIYDMMMSLRCPITTICAGQAWGHAALLVAAGDRGLRFTSWGSTFMLHQPRYPPTGQRQASEVNYRWKEVNTVNNMVINTLAHHTGHSPEKIDRDSVDATIMTGLDAIEYGLVDSIISLANLEEGITRGIMTPMTTRAEAEKIHAKAEEIRKERLEAIGW